MRNFDMVNVARKMNDLYDELVLVHKWSHAASREMVVSFFSEGYTK